MTQEHPEDWDHRPSRDDVREALNEVEREANTHRDEYAAGMRAARLIVEEALLG